MTLHAYLGKVGTGRSMKMLAEMKQEMKADPLGDPIILTAPTQSAFQLEQAFINGSELNGSLRTEVSHLERLSYHIFQKAGNYSEQKLSETAAEMMIYSAAQERQKYLKLYRS